MNNIFEAYEVQNLLPIYCNFDFFKSIEFDKGCYLGQETSARQFFTGHYYQLYRSVYRNTPLYQNMCSCISELK